MDICRFRHYTLNHEVLDNAHWQMLSMIEELVSRVKHFPCDTFDAQFDKILDYMIMHDGQEDDIMIEYKYPFIDTHRLENNNLIDCAIRMRGLLRTQRYTYYDLKVFEESFIYHIDHHDRQITDYIASISKI